VRQKNIIKGRQPPLVVDRRSVSVPVVVEFLEEDGVYMVSVPWLHGVNIV
jgi:hypothetical protein